MPEREGKNRVCGCKVLLHHNHTTTYRANSWLPAHCTVRGPTEDDGRGRRTVWPINCRLADWQVLDMEATEVCEAQQAVSTLTGS